MDPNKDDFVIITPPGGPAFAVPRYPSTAAEEKKVAEEKSTAEAANKTAEDVETPTDAPASAAAATESVAHPGRKTVNDFFRTLGHSLRKLEQENRPAAKAAGKVAKREVQRVGRKLRKWFK